MNFLPNPSSNYQQYDSLGSGGVGTVAALWALNKSGLISQDQMNSMLSGNKNTSGNMLYNAIKPPTTAPVVPGAPTGQSMPVSPTSQATPGASTSVSQYDPDMIDGSIQNFANLLGASAMA
jgi:hypothetical protein